MSEPRRAQRHLRVRAAIVRKPTLLKLQPRTTSPYNTSTSRYSTRGRRDGDPSNPDIYPDFLEMNRRTTEGYAEYRACSVLAPCCAAQALLPPTSPCTHHTRTPPALD